MIEHLWKTLASVNEWVRFSEGKAIALLAAQGVLIGLLSQDKLLNDQNLTATETVLGIFAVLFNALSMLYAFLCLNPRLKLKGGVSPIYFSSIATSFQQSEEYRQFYKERMNEDDSIEKEVCGQIFVNSQIAMRKYNNIAYSLRLFFTSALLWVIFLLCKMVG